jgi:hypothetical protein
MVCPTGIGRACPARDQRCCRRDTEPAGRSYQRRVQRDRPGRAATANTPSHTQRRHRAGDCYAGPTRTTHERLASATLALTLITDAGGAAPRAGRRSLPARPAQSSVPNVRGPHRRVHRAQQVPHRLIVAGFLADEGVEGVRGVGVLRGLRLQDRLHRHVEVGGDLAGPGCPVQRCGQPLHRLAELARHPHRCGPGSVFRISPVMVGTAKLRKFTPRAGSNRSNAPSNPTAPACCRSSTGSPRPWKWRAMLTTTGQNPAASSSRSARRRGLPGAVAATRPIARPDARTVALPGPAIGSTRSGRCVQSEGGPDRHDGPAPQSVQFVRSALSRR